ncbi:unnamed protein product [Sphacelaria rigidula]
MLPDVGGAKSTAALAAAPSPLDLWRLRRLGLECSRALGVWMAEDPESLPQRFLEALPTLLALNARPEPPDSDDEDSDGELENDSTPYFSPPSTASPPPSSATAALRAFPGVGGQLAALSMRDADDDSIHQQAKTTSGDGAQVATATAVDEALHNILRAMLALSYEPAPLAAMVEEGVTARICNVAAAGAPAIAALLSLFADAVPAAAAAAGQTSADGPSSLPPEFVEQAAEALRSPLITACSLLTNILTSAGHLAWPEPISDAEAAASWRATGGRPPPSYPVLAHPTLGECLASLAEVAGLAGAARRRPTRGGPRGRLLAAHATLVVMTVARASSPENGLAPARDLAARRARWGDGGAAASGGDAETVWAAMVRAVDEALGSLSAAPGLGLIGGRGGFEDEEASYEEGAIWQWCLECARAIEASPGGAAGNAFVASGVLPRRVLKILAEASSDGRI